MFHLAARRGARSESKGAGEGRERMRGGREGKGRTREDWYRPRVQGHECEGYRTSLPPNAERIYRVPCDDALAFPRSAEAGGEEKRRGG